MVRKSVGHQPPRGTRSPRSLLRNDLPARIVHSAIDHRRRLPCPLLSLMAMFDPYLWRPPSSWAGANLIVITCIVGPRTQVGLPDLRTVLRRSPWADGLPPAPSSSSSRWVPPTRRLGRTPTQRDR